MMSKADAPSMRPSAMRAVSPRAHRHLSARPTTTACIPEHDTFCTARPTPPTTPHGKDTDALNFADACRKRLPELMLQAWGTEQNPDDIDFGARWAAMREHTLLMTCEDEGRIVSACSAVLEPRLSGGLIAHGENMVTHQDFRRRGYARRVISALFERVQRDNPPLDYVLCSALQPCAQTLYRTFGLQSAGIQLEHQLISPRNTRALPANMLLRRLVENDVQLGLSQLMAQSKEGDVQASINENDVRAYLRHAAGVKETWVVEWNPGDGRRRLVGMGHVFFEHKLTEGDGRPTAHFSDLVVDKAYRRQGLGQALFGKLTERAKTVGACRALMQAEKRDLPFLRKQGARVLSLQLAKPISPAAQEFMKRNAGELKKTTAYLKVAYGALYALETFAGLVQHIAGVLKYLRRAG